MNELRLSKYEPCHRRRVTLVQMLANGYTLTEIARLTRRSPQTVCMQAVHTRRFVGARSTADLVAVCRGHGVVR